MSPPVNTESLRPIVINLISQPRDTEVGVSMVLFGVDIYHPEEKKKTSL